MRPKILILTIGTKGDFLPFLSLARSLRALGHDIHILTNEAYQPLCAAAGFPSGSIVSREVSAAFDEEPNLWTPLRGMRHFLRNGVAAMGPGVFAAIARHAERQPCVLVTNHILAGSFIAAEKYNLPIVSVFVQPFSHISAEEPAPFSPAVDFISARIGSAGRRLMSRASLAWAQSQHKPLNHLREVNGLAPWSNYLSEGRYRANLVLGLWPEWYCPPKADWPKICQNVGFADTSWNEKPIAPDSPLHKLLGQRTIVFAVGSEMKQNFEANRDLFQQACIRLNFNGVFVSPVIRGQGAQQVSDRFLVVEAAPFTELFHKAHAVVSHGGIGTLAKIMKAGKPTLSLPMAYDQFDNARIAERLGFGLTLPRKSATLDSLTRALAQVAFSPGLRQTALTMNQRMHREQGSDKAAALIDQLCVGQPQQVVGL